MIREKSQFKIGPIGVARASTGGKIIGDQISQSANRMAQMFFEKGAQEAEKLGLEQGAAVEREKVLTINPETGEPEAYAPPSGYGTIASEAYQRVVMRRFQQSIDDEMQNKAKELAVRFEASSNASGLYEQAMSDYIASMSNAAQGQFKTYIEDVGTTYLNATRTNLAIKQVRQERAAAKAAQAASIASANNNIEMMVAQYGPSQLKGPTQTNAIIQSANQGVVDGAQANLFDPAVSRNMNRETRLSMTRGLLRYAATQTEDPDALTLLQHAVGTQNPSLVPKEFSYVADAMSSFAGDYKSLAGLEKFSDGLLSDQIQYAKVVQTKEREELEAQQAASLFAYEQGNVFEASAVRQSVMSSGVSPISSASSLAQNYSTYTQMALKETNEDKRDALIKRRDEVFDAGVEGVGLTALRGLNANQVDSVTQAVFENNPSLAPESAQRAVSALIMLDGQFPGVADSFMSFAETYKTRAGKARLRMDQAQAEQVAMAIPQDGIVTADNPSEVASAVKKEIGSVENLDSTVKKNLMADAEIKAGRGYLTKFFSGSVSEEQIAAASSLLEGGEVADGVLSKDQTRLLKSAVKHGNAADNMSRIRTIFNNQRSDYNTLRRLKEEAAEEAKRVSDISNGLGSSTRKTDRETQEGYLEKKHEAILSGRRLSDIWSDPNALSDEELLPIFNDIASTNVIPESLHNALTQLSHGSFVGTNSVALLSHYRNFRDYRVGTETIASPMMDSLSEAEQATLDYLVDMSDVAGANTSERIAQMYSAMSKYVEDPNYQAKVNAALGDKTPSEFVMGIDEAKDLPVSGLNAMRGAVVQLHALGQYQGITERELKRRIERQIARTYPDGETYVIPADGSKRTRHALSKVFPGNEGIVRQYVENLLEREGSDSARYEFGNVRRGLYRGPYNFLRPIVETAEGVTYQVMTYQEFADGGVKPATSSDGSPLYVSSFDGELGLMLSAKKAAERVNKVMTGESARIANEELMQKDFMDIGGVSP